MADKPTARQGEHLLDITEVSAYLGIPKQTIYRWRVNGLGPRAIKLGKHLRYRNSDVQEWLDNQSDGDRG